MIARFVVATAVFFSATTSFAPAALAQEREGLLGETPKLEVSFKASAGNPAQAAAPGEFVCVGECPFPDETLLNVGLRRKGQDKYIGDAWARCVVNDGKYTVSLGPWGTRAVVRGDYVIDTWMEMARQPNHVYGQIRSKYRFERDHREKVATSEIVVGGAAGADADTAAVNAELRELFGAVRQLSEEAALKIAEKPAPAKEERVKWRSERMPKLAEVSDRLKSWYGGRIGILGEEHVGFIELLIAAVNQQMRYWERNPESQRVVAYGDQAAKLIADFQSVSLPGEKLRPVDDGGEDEEEEEREGAGD